MPPPEEATAAAEAVAARDSCADLDDAVAAQSMELERLRQEAARADTFLLRQVSASLLVSQLRSRVARASAA